MINFTAYRLPLLAVPCPVCRKGVGVDCKRPSGHKANPPHAERLREADRIFIAQHGENASIEWIGGAWVIDPVGRITLGQHRKLLP